MLRYILVILFILGIIGRGHCDESTPCGQNFSDMEENCIAQFESKMNPGKITLNVKDMANVDAKAINMGDVYFFKTKDNFFGKYQVKFVHDEPGKGECSIYLSSEVFKNNKLISKEGDYSINSKLGVWSSKSIDIDSTSVFDFILRRSTTKGESKEVCFLDSVDTKVYRYGNFEVSPLKRGSALIYLAMLALFGISAFMFAMTIFKDEGSFAVQEKFEDLDSNKIINYAKYGIVLKYSRIFFRRYFTPIVQGMKNKNTFREKYRRPLANGGVLSVVGPEDFFAFKLFLIIGFPVLFLAFRFLMDMDWSLMLTPLVSFIGFLYPDIWLKSRIEQRKKEIIVAMPFIVDMLALSIEAGLDFVAAIARVIEKAPRSALTEEFEMMIKDIKIGSSRADALRQLSWRVDEIVVNSFCATLIAADSVGASVGPILKVLSGEIRQKRSALIEQAGAKAATKILLPMIVFILPAVFIITFAPLALDIIGK